jgi:tetratricopeptide (TPR) repeat protein
MLKQLGILLLALSVFYPSASVRGQECCDRFNTQLERGEYLQVLKEGTPLLERVSGKQKYQLLVALGAASFQLGKFVESTQFWEQGIQLEPQKSSLKIDLAQAWLNKGNPERALSILERIPETEYIGEKYALMGNIAFVRDNFAQAIGYFEKSLPFLPERWVESVKRNLVFSTDRQSKQLLAIVNEVSEGDRAQVLK